jgi:hypothetical protein
MGPADKLSILRSMRRLHRRYVKVCQRGNKYWEISVEDFHRLTSSDCHYCGKPPMQISRTYKYNGLDRKNSQKGYQLENVVPCCKECNFIKGRELTYDEAVVVLKALTDYRIEQKKRG